MNSQERSWFYKLLDKGAETWLRAQGKLPAFYDKMSSNVFGDYNSDKRKDDNASLNSDWVYRACDVRAHAVASSAVSDMYLHNSVTGAEIEKHVLLELFNRVNDYLTRYELFYTTQYHIDLFDDAWWFVDGVESGVGLPKQIFIIYPDMGRMRAVKNQFGSVQSYELRSGMKTLKFNPRQIVHFKSPSIMQGVYGDTGLVSMLYRYAKIDRRQKDHGVEAFDNQSIPSLAISLEQTLGKSQFEEYMARMQETYGGNKRPRGIAVFDGAKRAEVLSQTQVELDYVNSMNLTRDHIMQIAGVSRILANIDSSTRADAEQGEYVFSKWTQYPLLLRQASTLTQDFCQRYYDEKLALSYRNPTKKDEHAQAELDEMNLNTGKATLNMFAKRDGRPELPAEIGDVYFIKSGLVPVSKVVAQNEGQQNV